MRFRDSRAQFRQVPRLSRRQVLRNDFYVVDAESIGADLGEIQNIHVLPGNHSFRIAGLSEQIVETPGGDADSSVSGLAHSNLLYRVRARPGTTKPQPPPEESAGQTR